MSDNNPLVLLQSGGALAVPQAFHSVMQEMQASEMQANVGQSFAVVSIKGKGFNIRFGGQTTPVTIQMNGATYMAPYFDVVIPKANAQLSKTYYKNGYTDGADEAPDCWSEDGNTPLGPLETRPIDPRNGQPCTNCQLCPMNVFGSKNSDNGSKGKACADTRKLIVVPCVPTGQKDANGNDVTVMDGENIKFGGPMLLRVPAASLKVFAEYDQKLQQMGLPYFAVVTRLEFDQTQAYPKFVLKATRVLTNDEATKVVEIRDSMFAKQILGSGQVGAVPAQLPGPSVAAVAGQQAPAALAQPAPAQMGTAVPVQPTTNVVPLPVQAPPQVPNVPVPPVQETPTQRLLGAGWAKHPDNAAYWYKGQQVLTEADALATLAPAAAPTAPPAAPAQMVPPAVAQPAPAGAATPQVTPGLLASVDSLLAG